MVKRTVLTRTSALKGIQHPNGVPATGEVKARRTWPFEAKALMVGLIVVGVYLAVSGHFNRGTRPARRFVRTRCLL
jgi:hypothetical protein